MTATSPEQVIQQFSLYLSDGNLEGALALYEPDATFAFQPGETVQGLDGIRSALVGFVTLKPKLTGEIQKVLEADETAFW
ncbi:MAG: nuclear transport factor 2 family protein [Actinomycetota bacterium]|nr:nuclear transport factor 2 family protein [Actinomycetota bacterium]MDQ3925781.1 nuclear transport factor 2 family protein [Actinomycetota bacterium]